MSHYNKFWDALINAADSNLEELEYACPDQQTAKFLYDDVTSKSLVSHLYQSNGIFYVSTFLPTD